MCSKKMKKRAAFINVTTPLFWYFEQEMKRKVQLQIVNKVLSSAIFFKYVFSFQNI